MRNVEKWKKILRELEVPSLRERYEVVPVKKIPLRVAKFDVALEEAPLMAVRAMRAILENMVMFRCWCCSERFPTFHPAYVPPESLKLELLKRGQGGRVACSVEVRSWDEVPPLQRTGTALVAQACTGLCQECHRDMEEQQRKVQRQAAEGEEAAEELDEAAVAAAVVPKRSERNCINAC